MAEHGTILIPDFEYKDRVKRAAAIQQRKGKPLILLRNNLSSYFSLFVCLYIKSFKLIIERQT